MNSKFALALIALVGVGVFALPSTMALFAGQHTFYNLDATGNQVPCQKCHGDVKVELSGDTAMAGSKAPHAEFKCEYCHRAEAGFASGDDAYAKIYYSYRTAAGTTAYIYLVTTVQNFETGNFPKNITFQTGMTVDNWDGNVFNLDGTPFVNKTEYQVSGKYDGSLYNATGVAGQWYAYSRASETSLRYANGTAKDTTNPNDAFQARKVTWSGTNEVLTGAGASEVVAGTRYHAASLVSCMECHGGEQEKGAAGYEIDTAEPYNHAGWLIDPTDTTSTCGNCHYGSSGAARELQLAAGGFQSGGLGLTTGTAEEGAVEAHNEFVVADSQGILRTATDGYGASNIACVACHTHVAVDINFQKKYKVKLDAYGTGTGTWNVGGYASEGDVMIAEYGNSDGSVFGVGNKSITWTPTSTLYINGNPATPILGLDNDTSDDQTALTTP